MFYLSCPFFLFLLFLNLCLYLRLIVYSHCFKFLYLFAHFYLLFIPADSPSCGGDVTVYVSDIDQLRLPTLFILFLCLFLSSWPFQLYSINSSNNCLVSHCSAGLFFCLIGPFGYVSLYESLSQPWCNPLWLTGLKAPTNQQQPVECLQDRFTHRTAVAAPVPARRVNPSRWFPEFPLIPT